MLKFSSILLVALLPLAVAEDENEQHLRRGLQNKPPPAPYKIALWGDLPYQGGDSVDVFNPATTYGPIYARMRDTINAASISFNIHSGDIKSGSSACGEWTWHRFEQLASSFNNPMVLSLGDNDWTDCHRLNNGNYNPLERLSYLRSRYYNSNGRTKYGLGTPIKTTVFNGQYPEMQMFDYGGVTYINAHIVGSNNALYGTPDSSCEATLSIIDPNCQAANAESAARTAAAIKLVNQGFKMAKSSGSAGVMVVIQANIFDGPAECEAGVADPCVPTGPVTIASGFTSFWENLVTATLAFGKPVILFHGDNHYYQYYPNPAGRAPNMVAVQNPGSADVGWVKAAIDVSTPEVFSFEHIDNTP